MGEAIDFVRLQVLGRERLASAISEALSREPGKILSRPLLHDDDWRLIVEALRQSAPPLNRSETDGGRGAA